jgi:hypothetical protein
MVLIWPKSAVRDARICVRFDAAGRYKIEETMHEFSAGIASWSFLKSAKIAR